MSIQDLIRALAKGRTSGDVAPAAPESRCVAYVTLVGGLQAPAPRQMHWWRRRGGPMEPYCLRCKARNPHYVQPTPVEAS